MKRLFTRFGAAIEQRVRQLIAMAASVVLIAGGAVGIAVGTAARAAADTQGPINFETYATGTVNGQDGWSSLGAAGSGCATYDHAIVDNSTLPGAPAGFGTQSLRISDAVTSGCFGDQTFSKKTTDEAGEPGADAGTFASGTRRSNFSASFDLASVTPGSEQPGLHMSVAPDRGDGARMSYVRIEDSAGGWNLFFDDYKDAAPLGSGGNLDDGCGVEDDFNETQVVTGLDSSVPHNIRFDMKFVPGPHNDVVNLSVDGAVVATGTSWEDYFRYCAESGGGTGGPLADQSRTVRSLLFRTSGDPDPGNAGAGFLIDDVVVGSGDPCTTTCYVDATSGNDLNPGTQGLPKKTIQAGIDAVNPNGTVLVRPGSYNETAANETPASIPGTYTFGLFLGKNGVTVSGVHANDTPITSRTDPAMPDVTTNSTANFGPDGVFVEGDHDTINALNIGENLPSGSCNKTIEVVGDAFTFSNGIVNDPCAGDIYIDDFRYNVGTDTPHVTSYTITGSEFGAGNTIDIGSGPGHGTAATNRVISNNVFDNNPSDGDYWPAISFNGADSGIPWFVYPVGGATITGNTFAARDQFIRARGTYDTATFNWDNYFANNTFAGATLTKTPTDVRTYAYTAPGASWANVRRINGTLQTTHASGCAGADCNGDVDNAQPGDTVQIRGTLNEDVNLNKAVSLLGLGGPTLNGSTTGVTVNSPGALSIKSIKFTGSTPSIGVAHTSVAPLIFRNSLQSLINSSTSNVDARCNYWGSPSGPSVGQYFGPVTPAPFLTTTNLAGACTPIVSLGTGAIRTVEGNSGAHLVTVTATLNGPSATTANVHWATMSGTAGLSDYGGATGNLSFLAGQTSKSFTVTVLGDTVLEPDESFTISLSGPTGAVLGVAHQTIIIENDEKPTLIPGVATPVTEGGKVQYYVSIAQQYTMPITVHIVSVNGTAHAGTDFTAVNTNVVIPAGTRGPFSLPGIQTMLDGVNEGAETFSLKFTSPSVNNSGKTLTVTIKANAT